MRVFVGWDSREIRAYSVCVHSLQRHASEPVDITPLRHKALRSSGYFTREWEMKDNLTCDKLDGKPFATEFAFTRFLVPALSQYEGWALFMDCDMLITGDIKEVFDMADDKYAVMCVKHNHKPKEKEKMDGAVQEHYYRKNWSSFMLFNCGHPDVKQMMTPDTVNAAPGSYLHGFDWLQDKYIGELPVTWNWLEGFSKVTKKIPKNIHYTRGGPWFPGYQDVKYADLWLKEEHSLEHTRNPKVSAWPAIT